MMILIFVCKPNIDILANIASKSCFPVVVEAVAMYTPMIPTQIAIMTAEITITLLNVGQ